MNQIHYELHDRLKTGDIMRLLHLQNYGQVKKVLREHNLPDVNQYGRTLTIKYQELKKAGIIK